MMTGRLRTRPACDGWPRVPPDRAACRPAPRPRAALSGVLVETAVPGLVCATAITGSATAVLPVGGLVVVQRGGQLAAARPATSSRPVVGGRRVAPTGAPIPVQYFLAGQPVAVRRSATPSRGTVRPVQPGRAPVASLGATGLGPGTA